MAWEHLSVNRPHLVYIILGGFTSLFMLCSTVIKERLYIGEATVATICGIIFGPHAANLIDPATWGNVDQITLEFSRVVLVVQCFAVGVELPKSYMERHWKSVTLLLVPVMTFGWLVTSLFIWWMFKDYLNWLDSLCIAACVTATDPVLASSVVGKGKFAKRVPKHLRDLLSAESGCNDGMAFPFIYLAIYIIRYKGHPNEVAFHWFCYTILYECVFGALYGVLIGYAARRAIRYAHEKDLIDRESFLVFYFVLALFCAGSGSILGTDDLLVGFACGVGFSNDGWFLEKTEEAHVSNVIDLLINLAFFVYFGTIIPWGLFNSQIIGTTPWRLVVVGILVIFFRRIPIMMLLKPIIPDIKTWREALFAGHFGPIGVGAIFVAILARAELETEETTPLAVLPEEGFPHLNVIELIWPITCFLVICSIIVHGSSIAVFTLGKHINTLTVSFSYTQANEEGPAWMERLPRIQSRSKSSMSMRRPDETDSSFEEKGEYPVGLPGNFLKRQKEEDTGSRPSSLKPPFRRKKWDAGLGPGGPISQSAIAPRSRNADHSDVPESAQRCGSDTLALNSDDSPESSVGKHKRGEETAGEMYQEGDQTIIEDEEGNVLDVRESKGESQETRKKRDKADAQNQMEGKDVQHGVAQTEHHSGEGGEGAEAAAKDVVERPGRNWKEMGRRMSAFGTMTKKGDEAGPSTKKVEAKRGPALAYQFGNTIIVEDEDGEVLKKYDIPNSKRPNTDRKASFVDPKTRARIQRMGTYMGLGGQQSSAEGEAGQAGDTRKKSHPPEDDDDHIRFTVTAGGRRMSKAEFIQQIQRMDPKARARLVEESDAPEAVKKEARQDAKEHDARKARANQKRPESVRGASSSDNGSMVDATIRKAESPEQNRAGPEGLTLVDSNDETIPFHSLPEDLANFAFGKETAAERRRQLAAGEEEVDSEQRPTSGPSESEKRARPSSRLEEGETAAERKRREGALGLTNEDSDSEDEEGDGSGLREPPVIASARAPGIRFAEPPKQQAGGSRLRWGEDVGKTQKR